jgi:hypothetical protein
MCFDKNNAVESNIKKEHEIEMSLKYKWGCQKRKKKKGDKNERIIIKDHINDLPVMVPQGRGLIGNSLVLLKKKKKKKI